MPQVATSDQLSAMRRKGQWSRMYAGIFFPHTVYSARLNGVPESSDMVAEISYDNGVGTLADVKPDMTIWVGTSAGAYDLGMVRVRTAPDSDTFFIGEYSAIDWQDECHLTVVDDFDLKAKHIHIDSGIPKMDWEISYSDQHEDFNPVPVLGPLVRVAKLEGAEVDVQLGPENGTDSWVFNSTITDILWECDTCAFDDDTAARPVGTFDSEGWHVLYCTVTSAAGKTKTGVRYVYIWSDDDPPFKLASPPDISESRDEGGGGAGITLVSNAGLSSIHDRALVVVFSEDHYDSLEGGTVDNVGPIAGAENIEFIGRIGSESIRYDAERSEVSLEVFGFQEWMKIIPGFPSGLEIATDTPDAWTDMPALTVDRAIWHLLEWRTTATVMMDVILTGDARYAVELKSLSNNLWSQIEEIALTSIFALPSVDIYGRFILQIEPQLTPEAERDFVEVMTLTKADYQGAVDVDRNIVTEVAQVDFSGINVDISGRASSFFSLAPGHVPSDYGSLQLDDKYLLEDQAGSNVIAGLIRSWLNNPYKPIVLNLLNNKMVSCFPAQYVNFTISAADTVRGISYSGRLIPIRRSLEFNVETGFKSYRVEFEAEVFESLAVDGDVPGSESDPSIQPLPPLPPLPTLPILYGSPSASPDGPATVIAVDRVKGILYTKNFSDSNPQWVFWNAGISAADLLNIRNLNNEKIHCFITPSGSVWLGIYHSTVGRYLTDIYYAQGIGGTFQKVIDPAWLAANEPGGSIQGISAFGYNPNKPEEIAFVAGNHDIFETARHFWIGNRNGFTQGPGFATIGVYADALTYGGGEWGYITYNGGATKTFIRFSADGTLIDAFNITNVTGSGALPMHVRAGTSKVIVAYNGDGDLLARSDDGGDNFSDLDTDENFYQHFALAPDGMYMMGGWDADTGARGKSSDGGATWSGLPSLPFGGDYAYAYAGGAGVASRWIAARGVVRYSPDFGVNWQNKEGNLGYLIPLGMSIGKIIVPGFANG